MIRLGLDPGLAHLGWVVRADADAPHTAGGIIASGVYVTKAMHRDKREAAGISKHADKLRRADELARFLDEQIRIFSVSIVAHEGASLGFHQALTLFDLGIGFGVIAAVAAARRCERVVVEPKAIKAWVRTQMPARAEAGLVKVEKEQVIEVARGIWPGLAWPRATLLWEHLADAAVVALLGGGDGARGNAGA